MNRNLESLVPVAGPWCKIILRMRVPTRRENGNMEICHQLERDGQIPREVCAHLPASNSFQSLRNKCCQGVIFITPPSSDTEGVSPKAFYSSYDLDFQTFSCVFYFCY